MKNLHKLKTKEKFFEREFFVFDTETTPFKLGEKCTFIFGVVYGYDYQKVIYSREEFIQEFKNKRYLKKKVFAHNAEFDLNVLYDNIFQLDGEAIFNGSRFICCSNQVCTFADSMNIFPTSVKKIGNMIGMSKKELSKEFWEKSDITANDITYCIRDCEIIYHALLEIFNKVNNVKITLAGLSLDLFRRFYQKFNIEYNDKLCNKFFNSYYGGRCEAFYIGKTNATVYDINSMYPYAMVNCKFPNPKFLKHKENVNVQLFIEKYLSNYEGIIFCRVKHMESYFGYLPVRHNDKLLFPSGNLRGYWNFNEIRYALRKSIIEISEITEIIYGEPIESPFIEYVNECYRLRFLGNDFNAYLYKNFANTLYGKFAQKVNSEQIYIADMTADYEIIETHKKSGKLKSIKTFNEFRNDCFLEIVADRIKYMINTIPLFSSYITSFARVLLLQKMIKYKDFNPLYCDTDSVFFGIDPKIENSKLLGEFKKEEKVITKINGLKNYDYICEDKVISKIKGIPKKAIFIDEHYEYETLVKTKEGLRRNIESGTTVLRKKKLIGRYEKRNVLPSGETTIISINID